MACVYILFSNATNRYYIGSCLDLTDRLQQHSDRTHGNAFTGKASDWTLYFSINELQYSQARQIEKHIKTMKSRKYIENLRKYPELVSSLIERFGAGPSR